MQNLFKKAVGKFLQQGISINRVLVNHKDIMLYMPDITVHGEFYKYAIRIETDPTLERGCMRIFPAFGEPTLFCGRE